VRAKSVALDTKRPTLTMRRITRFPGKVRSADAATDTLRQKR
jgi:hypothetical protein